MAYAPGTRRGALITASSRLGAKGMERKAIGILVGGGPAPGINGTIAAAVIEAINRGHKVFGIRDGFAYLGQGDASCVRELRIEDVSRVHDHGGSILGTSRVDPQKMPGGIEAIVDTLRQFNIGYLACIGGDGTASNAMAVAKAARNEIAVALVPKTIDNDLPLPDKLSTFGFQTARDVGAGVVQTLMTDAKTLSRWYAVVTMGRKAGHLALGIGMSAGATLSIIPEEFGERPISMRLLTDIIVGSMLKRYALGRPYGVVVIAEGIVEKLDQSSRESLGAGERDPHGNIRISALPLGAMIESAVGARLKELQVDLRLVSKDVGYELRCCAPNAFDRQYTRELGYGVVDFLLSGGSAAMIARRGDALVPIPFAQFIEAITNRTSVRMVDVTSTTYLVARKYMIRLTDADLGDERLMERMAKCTSWTLERLRNEFRTITSELASYPEQMRER